jgi:hypothetical protein
MTSRRCSEATACERFFMSLSFVGFFSNIDVYYRHAHHTSTDDSITTIAARTCSTPPIKKRVDSGVSLSPRQ